MLSPLLSIPVLWFASARATTSIANAKSAEAQKLMPQKSRQREILEKEWKVAKVAQTANAQHSDKDARPTVFFNMPIAANEGWSNQLIIGIPDGFFSANHCNTKWLLNVMADGADFRLQRLLKQNRTRALFSTDKYYQLYDQPHLYTRMDQLSRPMFRTKASLYLNCFGVAIYLHLYNALGVLAKQISQGEPFISHNQENYATDIHDNSTGDVIVFHYDYIMLKREAYDSICYLLDIKWIPNNASKIVYRRRYYQYVTPFIDWVDVCRHILRYRPTLQISKVLLSLINSRKSQFNVMELKETGKVMLEYFELKELTKENFVDSRYHRYFAGRKLMHDTNPNLPMSYMHVFDQNPVRPVIPNAVSAPRRFIGHTYYYDLENLTTLSQMLAVTEVFQQNRFFSCDRNCSEVKWHKDPLIFQIHNIVNIKCKPLDRHVTQSDEKRDLVLLREQNWSDIKKHPDMFNWFHRFDILNCISLLFGMLQACLFKNLPSSIVDRICRLLLNVLVTSEFIEPALMYSFYDTYFALTSVVNCVPGLQSTSVMRMLKRAPLLLTCMFSKPQLVEMFSVEFWGDAIDISCPTMEAIGEYLVSRKRVMSMQVTSGEGGEAMSRTSAMGASGSVILFARDFELMPEVTQAEEEAQDQSKSDAVKKAHDELKHIKKFRRMEIDHRYASIFGEPFRYAVERPKIILRESKTFEQNVKETLNRTANRW